MALPNASGHRHCTAWQRFKPFVTQPRVIVSVNLFNRLIDLLKNILLLCIIRQKGYMSVE
jgi:hypothetical protein